MLARRSILAFLGFAPVATPAVIAAAAARPFVPACADEALAGLAAARAGTLAPNGLRALIMRGQDEAAYVSFVRADAVLRDIRRPRGRRRLLVSRGDA